jgi:hypothetical protein
MRLAMPMPRAIDEDVVVRPRPPTPAATMLTKTGTMLTTTTTTMRTTMRGMR